MNDKDTAKKELEILDLLGYNAGITSKHEHRIRDLEEKILLLQNRILLLEEFKKKFSIKNIFLVLSGMISSILGLLKLIEVLKNINI